MTLIILILALVCLYLFFKLKNVEERVKRIEQGQLDSSSAQVHLQQMAPPAQAPSIDPAGPQIINSAPMAAKPSKTREFLARNILAVSGAGFVFLGAVFFLLLAINNGWISETTQFVIALIFGGALMALGHALSPKGPWQRVQDYAHDALSQSLLGTGAAVMFLSCLVGTRVYEIIEAPFGLVLAVIIGASATYIAVNKHSQIVAAIGLGGALISPILVDAPASGYMAMLFVAVALCGTAIVASLRLWPWLLSVAFALSIPQLIAWVDEITQDSTVIDQRVWIVMTLYWLVFMAATVAHELRYKVAGFRPATRLTSALVTFSLAFLAAAVADSVWNDQIHTGAIVFGWGCMVLVLATFLYNVKRQMKELGTWLAIVGMIIFGCGVLAMTQGIMFTISLAVMAMILLVLNRQDKNTVTLLASIVAISGAVLHMLYLAPIEALAYGMQEYILDGYLSIATVVALGLGMVIVGKDRQKLAKCGSFIAGSALLYFVSIGIVDVLTVNDQITQSAQLALSILWAVAGLSLVVYGLKHIKDIEIKNAGLALLAITATKVALFDVQELEQVYRIAVFMGLGVLLLMGAYFYGRLKDIAKDQQPEVIEPDQTDRL